MGKTIITQLLYNIKKKSHQFILKHKFKSEKATTKKFNWVWLLGLEASRPY